MLSNQKFVEVLVRLDPTECEDGQEVSSQTENAENENSDSLDPKMSAEQKIDIFSTLHCKKLDCFTSANLFFCLCIIDLDFSNEKSVKMYNLLTGPLKSSEI